VIHGKDTTATAELVEACKSGNLTSHRVMSLQMCARIISAAHDRHVTAWQVQRWEKSGLIKIKQALKGMGIESNELHQ